MKHSKKFAMLLLSLILIFTLTGCNAVTGFVTGALGDSDGSVTSDFLEETDEEEDAFHGVWESTEDSMPGYTLVLGKDNLFIMAYNTYSQTGSWEKHSDEEISLSMNGEEVNFQLKDGELTPDDGPVFVYKEKFSSKNFLKENIIGSWKTVSGTDGSTVYSRDELLEYGMVFDLQLFEDGTYDLSLSDDVTDYDENIHSEGYYLMTDSTLYLLDTTSAGSASNSKTNAATGTIGGPDSSTTAPANTNYMVIQCPYANGKLDIEIEGGIITFEKE